MTAEVNGRRSQGRQKKRCGDMIQDMKSLRLKNEHMVTERSGEEGSQ